MTYRVRWSMTDMNGSWHALCVRWFKSGDTSARNRSAEADTTVVVSPFPVVKEDNLIAGMRMSRKSELKLLPGGRRGKRAGIVDVLGTDDVCAPNDPLPDRLSLIQREERNVAKMRSERQLHQTCTIVTRTLADDTPVSACACVRIPRSCTAATPHEPECHG